jgi:hypothetical protein
MKNKTRILVASLVVLIFTLSIVVVAQVNRPYRNGSVWQVSFIRMKPGMESAYLDYIATDWKRNQETMKKDRLILSYKVLTTEAHGAADWNILLMTEYKDMATLEANEAKEDALYQRVIGNDEKQRQGYRERLEVREVMGGRLAREIVLEPRR